jgi:hypothetical protein
LVFPKVVEAGKAMLTAFQTGKGVPTAKRVLMVGPQATTTVDLDVEKGDASIKSPTSAVIGGFGIADRYVGGSEGGKRKFV